MAGDVINLRQARKAKARRDKESRAEANRARFGRTKAEKARDADQADRATNLFGVLVLDDYVNQGSYAYLKRFDKFKPNPISKLNGNSYGLKFDIKFDTSIDNAGVEVVVNEYNTFSMDLYADTMNRVQELTDLFRDNLVVTAELKEAIDKLEQRGSMRDDNHGLADRKAGKLPLDFLFTRVIHRAGRLVEQKDRRVGDGSAGNGHPLTLTAGQ